MPENKELVGVLFEALENYNKEANKKKSAAGTPTYTELHGIGGIFSTPGLDRDIVSAHVRPTGIANNLPMFASNSEDPRFGALVGYTATTGARPTNPCADAPKGYVKGAALTARFGLVRQDTQEIDMYQVGMQVNRGDFTDLQLQGQVLGLSGLTPGNMNSEDILTIVTKSEMVIAAVNAERTLSQDMWQGTWGSAGEFPGLDSQINTGIIDADTGTAVPGLDSDVRDFAFDDVGGGGRSIVEYLSSMEYYVHNNAVRMGLMPATWVIGMRPELWEELTAIWPCQYNTDKCSTAVGSNSTVFIDGRENIAQRDSMRKGLTLEINGRSYPVVLDDGIYEDTNITSANLAAGEYASSIYFLPLKINGNFPVLYRQYIDYRGAMVNQNVSLLRGTQDFWSDDGVYGWAVTQEKWCVQMHLRTQQRIVLRTPQLAGKLQNVKYVPLKHLRSPYPDSPYFMDGGVSSRAGESFQQVWGNG